MTARIKLITALLCALAISGCTANHAPDGRMTGDSKVYAQRGMEISKVASQMADTLTDTLWLDLKDQHRIDGSSTAYPTIGVTSFVDTDTYENAGVLGRQLGEFFIHELDRRGIPVAEFKLTGNITVTSDGEDVFTRNWKKLALKAKFRHVLAGTISRNEQGVVLLARIIDMQSSEVKGSATGFIPYRNLPYCYRTADKNCTFEGTDSYLTYIPSSNANTTVEKNGIKDTVRSVTVVSSSANTLSSGSFYKNSGNIREDARDSKAREKLAHDPNFNDKYYPVGAKVSATSTGNYEEFIHDHGSMRGHSSVVYPADSYSVSGHLIRDVHDQSQYQRIDDN